MTITSFAINGAGRIGRLVARAYFTHAHRYPHLALKAINDPHDPHALCHLLTYDSTHGTFEKPVTLIDNNTLRVGEQSIHLSQSRDPKTLPWRDLGIDCVMECTGKLKTHALASGHLQAGCKQVILSCPSPDADQTIVLGANDKPLSQPAPILSIGSCTTNALAPLLACIDAYNPVQHGFITTVHAYTGDQALVDRHHSDLRRARAAAYSIIPTKTGAAKAIGQVLPHLAGKLQGYALRVPTANVSALEVQLTLQSPCDTASFVAYLKNYCQSDANRVLAFTEEPLVSVDFNKHPASAIIDANHIQCQHNTVKLLAWYDNEWAYALRMLDTLNWLNHSVTHHITPCTETAYA